MGDSAHAFTLLRSWTAEDAWGNTAEANQVIAAATDLDAAGSGLDDPRSLRWVLVHMIEETARHLGHVDILREQTDGATGYVPDL